MPKFPTSGRVRVSLTAPGLSTQRSSNETEVKYFGLVRDDALFDIEEPSEALGEVLRDVQDPAEALVEGEFTTQDVEIIDGITRYNLKNEDFSVLSNASINFESSDGRSLPLVNPRQRVADRIKQLEFFAGRGTIHQGQGTVMYKYQVPNADPDANTYNHTSPPPFYTEELDSVLENAPNFIPSSPEELETTHRVGYLENGIFVPSKESEWWWSGEYERELRDRSEYGSDGRTFDTDPKFPIIRDGNISFRTTKPEGITSEYNWGLRLDTWMKIGKTSSGEVELNLGRFRALVNGHIRIDYFDRTGYDANGVIQGSWKTALDTTQPGTYYVEDTVERAISDSTYGYSRPYVQGGPSVPMGSGAINTPRDAAGGGLIDFSETFTGLEGESLSKFDNTYVPVVIRFWYGKPKEIDPLNEPSYSELLEYSPAGSPAFVLDWYWANGYTAWNDYSSRVKFAWSDADSAWVIDSGAGVEGSLTPYNTAFQVCAYKFGGAGTNPDGAGLFNIQNWDTASVLVTGRRADDGASTTNATFSVPGITPVDGDVIWVVLRNRPSSAIPYTTAREELWQRYLFDPDQTGNYETTDDLLENVGINYFEPDPQKVAFDVNYDYYKIKYGELPALNTYGPNRYDGSVPVTLTSSAGDRDYDYNHSKLLMVGRQRKGTEGEIGTTPPLVGKNLNSELNEIRLPGENYTFINVVSDANNNGGNVIINAFPANNISILNAGNSGTLGYALNLSDNTSTYNSLFRQNIQNLEKDKLPTDVNFDVSAVLLYKTGGYFFRTDLAGTTYDTNSGIGGLGGVLATAPLGNRVNGVLTRSHAVNSGFTTKFKMSDGAATGTEYSFYGLISFIRPSLESVGVTTEASSKFEIASPDFFPDILGVNASTYNGTIIEFKDGAGAIIASAYITSYDSVNKKVTYTFTSGVSSIAVNTNYTVDIWFNYLRVSSLPSNVVTTSGSRTSNPITNDSKLQIEYVFNSGYQFSRVDTGAGLSFSETLFFAGDDNITSAVSPFLQGTEASAPPAEIVTPFSYDNTVSSSDPGLGGITYPPYSTQNIRLEETVKSTSNLVSEEEGKFDVWFGSTTSVSDLGGRYLEITKKLMFDFDKTQRVDLLSSLSDAQKPDFIGASPTPYTHKLSVELSVDLPAPVSNDSLYLDAQNYSNNKPVKDQYFLFVKQSGSNLELLTANNPSFS